jgi:hypothetical protein
VLAVVRVRFQGAAGRGTASALVPVFVAGPCPPARHRREVRARAEALIARSAPLTAEAVLALAKAPRMAESPFNREAHLAKRGRTRQAVQAGLFDRRAEREIERRAGHPAASDVARAADDDQGGIGARGTGADDARLELIMFITS